MTRLLKINSNGKKYSWVTVYLDGETFTIDKSKIRFLLDESVALPLATTVMIDNPNKGKYSPEVRIHSQLIIQANQEDVDKILADITENVIERDDY